MLTFTQLATADSLSSDPGTHLILSFNALLGCPKRSIHRAAKEMNEYMSYRRAKESNTLTTTPLI